MARSSLMLIPIALVLMSAKGCQTIEQRALAAAIAQGEARAASPFPDLPDACTAKTGRVVPSPAEPRVVTLKRWETVAAIRDRKADDCAAWGLDMKVRWSRDG